MRGIISIPFELAGKWQQVVCVGPTHCLLCQGHGPAPSLSDRPPMGFWDQVQVGLRL